MAASVYKVCKHGEKLAHSRGKDYPHHSQNRTFDALRCFAAIFAHHMALPSYIRVNFVGKRRPVFLVACAYGAYNKHREQTTESTKYSVGIKGHDTKECILLYHVLFRWEDLWTEYGI